MPEELANYPQRYTTTRNLRTDEEAIRARLMAKSQMLYGEYDRFRSEAEFRAGIIPPSLLLIGYMVFKSGPLWSFAIIALIGLWLQAMANRNRADLVLATALSVEEVTSPHLERLEKYLDQLERVDLSRQARGALDRLTHPDEEPDVG